MTLSDGTAIPFLLRPPRREAWGRTDQQVNVFKDRASYDAMFSALNDALNRERALEAEVERFRTEELSPDHALASLLANGDLKYTPFMRRQKWMLKADGADILVEVLTSKTVPKTAVLFTITNQDSKQPWALMGVRLSALASRERRPFALRTQRSEIAPGASGRIAVVADGSAFTSRRGPEQLVLELFRSDGMAQA